MVWNYVSEAIRNPEELRADLDRMIECERRWTQVDPGARARLWTEKLAEVERRRARYQEALAADAMTLAELKAYLAQFDETRKTAEYEWETLWAHDEYVHNLEADREALVDPLEGLIYFPQTLTLKTSGSSSLRGALYGDYFRVASLRIGQNSRTAMSNVPSFYS